VPDVARLFHTVKPCIGLVSYPSFAGQCAESGPMRVDDAVFSHTPPTLVATAQSIRNVPIGQFRNSFIGKFLK